MDATITNMVGHAIIALANDHHPRLRSSSSSNRGCKPWTLQPQLPGWRGQSLACSSAARRTQSYLFHCKRLNFETRADGTATNDQGAKLAVA